MNGVGLNDGACGRADATAGAGFQIATLNGRIILHGGSSNTPGMKCQDDAWVFDPVTSTVRARALRRRCVRHLVCRNGTQRRLDTGA
jgi:hypothetical protein